MSAVVASINFGTAPDLAIALSSREAESPSLITAVTASLGLSTVAARILTGNGTRGSR
jgi:hypothetical protein